MNGIVKGMDETYFRNIYAEKSIFDRRATTGTVCHETERTAFKPVLSIREREQLTERKKTCRGGILTLVLASVAICALVCGCTTAGGATTDEVATITTGEISESTVPQDDTPQGPPGNRTAGGGFDLASAAEQLGVTEDALEAALGGGRMDLEAAAEELGVTVEELQKALGGPTGGERLPNGTPPATPSG
jgi:hypothetical protein